MLGGGNEGREQASPRFLAGPRNGRKGGDDEGEGRLCYNRRIQPRFHTCNSTMQLPEISFEIDDRVAFVILKGEDDLNRVTAGMYEDLSVAVDSIIDDGNVRAVVVTGEGSVFSGGTEEAVREMRDGGGEGMTGASGHIARLPMPVIAAINGDVCGLRDWSWPWPATCVSHPTRRHLQWTKSGSG